MPRGRGPRSDGIDVPSWWLALLNELVNARLRAKETTLTKIGAELSRAIGRTPHWDHGAVSRFLDGANTTREMAEAFALILPIPSFIYRARSQAEALELQQVIRRFDAVSSAKREERLSDLDHVLEQHETETRAHGPAINSEHGPGRRRTRRSV